MTKKIDKSNKDEVSASRRSILGGSAVALGGLMALQSLAPGKARAQARGKVKTPPGPPADTFTVAIVGEAMGTRPFSMQTDPGLLAIVKILRDADLAYGHLEMNIADRTTELKWTPRGSSGGAGYLVTSPKFLEDLAWAGIDVLSTAHNHSLDWGPEGLLATIKHCQEVGIACAGTGINLETARAPGYFELDKGRMSLVSISSGNSAFEWAGFPKGPIPGRPGVNPMRLKTVYEVPKATADQLKAAGRSLGVLSAAAAARPEFNITPGAISGSNGFSGFAFREGPKFDVITEANPADLKGNLRSIDEAQKMSEFVLVAQHNSTSEQGRGTTPSDFIIDFARKAIDAGADMYLGHGWHTFLGIEIYKGKPIFYGLGSFFWQSAFIPNVPADSFESYAVDMDNLNGVNTANGNLHPEGSDDWGWSAVYECKYVNKKLTQIVLHPIDMGYDYSGEKPVRNRELGKGAMKYLDGSPRLSTGANGQAILQKLKKICAERGANLEIQGGVGVINVA